MYQSAENGNIAGRRHAPHFAIQADQPVARQAQLAFQHLHARAEFDQRDGTKDLLYVTPVTLRRNIVFVMGMMGSV
jgi:hypothetical protein